AVEEGHPLGREARHEDALLARGEGLDDLLEVGVLLAFGQDDLGDARAGPPQDVKLREVGHPQEKPLRDGGLIPGPDISVMGGPPPRLRGPFPSWFSGPNRFATLKPPTDAGPRCLVSRSRSSPSFSFCPWPARSSAPRCSPWATSSRSATRSAPTTRPRRAARSATRSKRGRPLW